MSAGRLKILVFVGSYLPGYKGGGPLRTISSMVEFLGNEIDFRIVTLDRDVGSNAPYYGIKFNEWQAVGKAAVYYISPSNITLSFLRRLIRSTEHDVLYLNSFFSPGFTIMPLLLRRLGLIDDKKAIVAPRGEFSSGALNLKFIKKNIYIYLAKKFGLYRKVVWQASSIHEMNDIRKIFEKAEIAVAPVPIVVTQGLSSHDKADRECVPHKKTPGRLLALFLSRISPMKNLDGALNMLNELTGEIIFDIYGPLEDRVYWQKCRRIIEKLPSNVHVQYKGAIDHEDVSTVMAGHDLFFLPTHGENFGHVIVEALSGGCPILISDKTPWRELEKGGVGWDLPLDRPELFTAILQQCVDMGDIEWQALSHRAKKYAFERSIDADIVGQNRALFCCVSNHA